MILASHVIFVTIVGNNEHKKDYSGMSELDVRELHDPSIPVPEGLQDNVAVTSLSWIYNWSRRSSYLAAAVRVGLLRD